MRYFFIDSESKNWRSIADPVAWSLENADDPILERAKEGLLKLSSEDGERIIRLVVRRCRMNLIELHSETVVIHHWGEHGQADVRPWFKSNHLARKEIQVVVRDRKKESFTTKTGDDYLYGDPLCSGFPLERYLEKWNLRYERETDDWTAAPCTNAGYSWEGIENNRIPWSALKSAWRSTEPLICLNCDQPTILSNFGFPWCGLLNRSTRFVHFCRLCRRLFQDHSVKYVGKWMAEHLDDEVRPVYDMIWNRRVKLKGEGMK